VLWEANHGHHYIINCPPHPIASVASPQRGDNDTQVRWFDKGSNMHRVWDSDLIEWNTSNEDLWLTELGELDTPENRGGMDGRVNRRLGHGIVAGRSGRLRGSGDRPAD
jgi:hypothetical protein